MAVNEVITEQTVLEIQNWDSVPPSPPELQEDIPLPGT